MKKMVFCIIPLIIILMGCASSGTAVAETGGDSPGMDLDAAIREAAVQMEAKIPSKTMVALVSVASPSTAFSTQVLTRLESAIVSSGKLVVVDRANLDKIRAEQGFQLSGEVDDESAKSIGKLLGAGAIVTGSLADLGDAYSLTLKAINIETATVAVSYLVDLAKSPRVETLLASGGGAASGGTATASGVRPVSGAVAGGTQTAVSPPVNQKIGLKVIAKQAGTLYFEDEETANLFEGDEYEIPLAGPGSFTVKMRFANGTEMTKKVVINNRGITSVTMDDHYSIGERGPAGGWIFYDKGFVSDGWRYLESAPVEVEVVGIEAGTWVPSGTSQGTGSGKENTAKIVNYHEEKGQTGKAAQLSDALVYGGYDDWFLPSKSELDLMYRNLKSKGLGGFSTGWYCSSSASSFGMWAQKFGNGEQNATNWNGAYDHAMDSSRVRAARAF
jgi:hypothetical protein